MMPLPTPLEAAQEREIKYLRAKLAHYDRMEELGLSDFRSIWTDVKTIEVQAPLHECLYMAARSTLEVDASGGYHIKARHFAGNNAEVGYYISRQMINYARPIALKVLQELLEDVHQRLAQMVHEGTA